MVLKYTIWFCIILHIHLSYAVKFKQIFTWNSVEFDWPSERLKKIAIESKSYVPENNVPLGLDRWRGKLFVTVPRWKYGVASTLNYVNIGEDPSPRLIPYPSWEANLVMDHPEWNNTSVYSTRPIGSVLRVWVDCCDRLWVLDDGMNGIFETSPVLLSDRSILIYDLNTNELLARHTFGTRESERNSFFTNIDAFAYIADVAGYKLVVYDFKKDVSWSIKHSYFRPDPAASNISVGGITAQWADGVLGLTLGKVLDNGFRTLYFNPLTSTTQFQVSTHIIKNQTHTPGSFGDFQIVGDHGSNEQSLTSCYDESTDVIFYTKVNKYGLSCWKSTKPFKPENMQLFMQDYNLLEFPADIKIDNERDIWVLSDRLTRFLYGHHDNKIRNIHVLTIHADEAIKNTNCSEGK